MNEGRKKRAILANAFTLYGMIEQIAIRCHDPVFKEAARRMVNEIKYHAGEED